MVHFAWAVLTPFGRASVLVFDEAIAAASVANVAVVISFYNMLLAASFADRIRVFWFQKIMALDTFPCRRTSEWSATATSLLVCDSFRHIHPFRFLGGRGSPAAFSNSSGCAMQHCASTSGASVFRKRLGFVQTHVMSVPSFRRPSNLKPSLCSYMEQRFSAVSIGHFDGEIIGSCARQHFAPQIFEQ